MNAKKLLISTVVGFIVLFFLGWLGHEVILTALFGESPTAAVEREEPLMLGIAAGTLVLALIMSYMYPKGVEGDSVMGNGLRFGVTVGLLISLPFSLFMYSFIPFDFSMVIGETVWHVIEEGAAGVAIAYAYGTGKADASDAPAEPSEPAASPHDHDRY